jgi:peptidoglycan/xylan/chitin deacetylase (PgdA/CDA1 family)
MLKPLAKKSLRIAAGLAGPHRWRKGPALLVLTYHRVLPEAHSDRASEQPGMLVTPALLAMHLATLKKHFTPVHLDDWLRASAAGAPPPGRALAVTFDDGWRDTYDHAYPVLQAAGVPATVFLVTDMVGSRYQFWPNRLARALRRWRPQYAHHVDESTKRRMVALSIPLDLTGDEATPELIDAVIDRCKVADDASMHAMLDVIEAVLPEEAGEGNGEANGQRDLVDWDEAREMAATGLVRFGSHTRRHTRLREDLSADQLADEIVGSRRVLEENLGCSAPLFCYPNGDASPQAYASVCRSYEGAVSTRRGWHQPGMDPYLVRRIGVHEDVSGSPAALLARVSGWRGL